MNGPDPDPPATALASRRYKIALYVIAWAAALFATNPSGSLFPLIYMFPLGLFAFLFPRSTASDGWAVLIGVLALYVVHAVVYFRAQTRGRVAIMLGILVLALICNVAGCRRMINTH